MSKRKPTRSGNPAVPPAPKLSMATGNLVLIGRSHEHQPDETGHRWILLAMHQVDPRRPAFYLGESTLVEAHAPRCAHCGAAYSAEVAGRFCPGVEQPARAANG